MKTKVSVIIPVYNAEKFLRICIESILSQTFQDFEVIMVDDGSKDKSLSICKELQQQDDRIRVFAKENGGPSSARKMGVEKSDGEFVFFVDADDTIPCDGLEKLLMHNINPNQIDIIQGARRFTSHNGSNVIVSGFTKEEIIESRTYIRYLFEGYTNAGPHGTLIKRGLFGEETFNLPDDVRNGEDFYMNMCLGINAVSIGLINDVVYNYNENIESLTHSCPFNSITPQMHLLESMRRELLGANLFNEFSMLFYSKAIGMLASACFHNKQLLYDKYCCQIVIESKDVMLSPQNKALRYMLKYPSTYYFYFLANRIRQIIS